jgi:hypothetical protein
VVELRLDVSELDESGRTGLAVFEGASSGLLGPPREAGPVPAEEGMNRTVDQIEEPGELKAQGVLTEEEIQSQKARILRS